MTRLRVRVHGGLGEDREGAEILPLLDGHWLPSTRLPEPARPTLDALADCWFATE